MKKNLQKNTYSQLVKDITELYDYARRALVEAYWRIGKRIVEQEQQGETNAIYGDHLLARLSEDLSETLDSGFSKRNLYNMRRFYLAHEENLQHAAKLTWTQHVHLVVAKIHLRNCLTSVLARAYRRFADVGTDTIHFTLGEFLHVAEINGWETSSAQGHCVTFFSCTGGKDSSFA